MAEAAQVQTLDELKDSNEEGAEEKEIESVDETVIEDEEGAQDTENVDESDDKTETDTEASTEDETDSDDNTDWMKSDDESDDKKFTDADIGRAKAKFKAKLEKQHKSEVDTLKAENEALKKASSTTVTDIKMPSRDDYLDEDEPDTAFMIALAKYNQDVANAESQAALQSNQLKEQQAAQNIKIKQGVDEHYERVVTLAEKSGISDEQYRGAELQVRQLVDDLYPDAGDALVDAFIAKVGVGSEKVFYNLGVNTKKRMQFKAALENDPTGIEASMFLGELKSTLNTPNKRKSNAPEPAAEMKADKHENSSTKGLRREYEKASESRDMQAMFNIRRKAKAAGISKKEINKW